MSATHGGIDPWAAKEAGIDPKDIRDFSISINPSPLPDTIRDVIGSAALYRYPDSRSRELIRALSTSYGIPEEEILVVNGTSQAIFLLAADRLRPGDTALVAGPSYGEYRDACESYGGEVIEITARADRTFHPDTDSLAAGIRKHRPRLFWICNPNSPTGAWIDEGERNVLAEACRESGCTMVMDEAYAKFSPPGLLPRDMHPDVVHLHSMTKDFCIPGLRLGWVRADARTIEGLRKFQPEWSVSAPAQDAGVALLDHLPYFEESWARTRALTSRLSGGLKDLGLSPLPTAGNFVMVKIGDDASVKALAVRLWKKLIMVRDCASFGLEGYIRIGTRSREDIDLLLALLREHLREES